MWRGETSRFRFHPPFARAGCGRASFSRAGGGVFSAPLEKTEMFLTDPQGRASAALSGLSDDAAGLKTFSRAAASRAAAEEFWPRWPNPGQPKQLETARF